MLLGNLLVPFSIVLLVLVQHPVAGFFATDHLHHRPSSSVQHFKQQPCQPQQHAGASTIAWCPTGASSTSCASAIHTTSCTLLMGHRNTARTDVQNLLTQRALQSFIDLLHNCRDGATVRWLEQTYGFRNLEMFHGTAGLDLQKYDQWDAIFFDMIQRPGDTVVVSAKRRGRGHGGWSKNNPFLEERFMEFSIDIDPPGLVARIISVRAQIAKDWLDDIRLLQQYNVACLEDDDVPFPYASSSFRSASVDLLALLATQESIHRLLRLERKDDTYDALRAYYVAHVGEYFDGSQTVQRFQTFLDDIQDDIVVQDIIEVRAMVFDEWSTSIKETDHGNLQQIILAIRMGRTFDTSPTEERSIFTPKKKSSSSSSRTAKAGATGAVEEEGLEFFQ